MTIKVYLESPLDEQVAALLIYRHNFEDHLSKRILQGSKAYRLGFGQPIKVWSGRYPLIVSPPGQFRIVLDENELRQNYRFLEP